MTDERRQDRILAALLGAGAFILARLTSTSVGFVRDEGYYFKAAEEYVGWYRQLLSGTASLSSTFSRAVIDRYFNYNHEHPALVKTSQGFAWWIWHELLGVGLNSEAFRIPGPLFTALCVACTYLLGKRFYGRSVGIFAAVAWALMPRNFFHEHLACFDVPVTAMTIFVVYMYVRAETSLGRAAWAGVAFGLCMATKHNSLFIPPLLVIHWLANEGWRFRRVGEAFVQVPGLPVPILMMLVVGPLVFLAHWPWLWHDTITRIGQYYGYHFLAHEHYPITYWGTLWRQPPFPVGFAFGMTLVTMPLPILGLSAWGLGLAVKDGFFTTAPTGTEAAHRKDAAWILGLFSIFPMFVISLPSTPIFGGVKHWMPATPFLAILAGRALQWALQQARAIVPAAGDPRAMAVVGAMMLVTSVTGILRSHPHGQSFYNELIGGARGAAVVGMQRHYWGEASRDHLPRLNEQVTQGGRVFFNRTNHDSWRMYRRDKLLRDDVGYAGSVAESQAAVAFHQWEHEHELYNIWNDYRSRKPVAGVYLEGSVPLTTLYLRGQ
ncbi:MAG: glycosyltransferase family 39 protein [Myxococcota bacterium]